MKNWLMAILSISLFLTGGNGFFGDSAPKPCRVVTEISVQYQTGSQITDCRYTDQKKMNKLLNYLRHLDPWNEAAPDPALPEETRYQITLHLSDGSTFQYAQQGYSYLQTGGAPWREIDPELGIRLPLLLAVMPGD